MAEASVSVCLPAYNEQDTLREVVLEASALLEAHPHLDYEILVCDDGSTDATPRILAELAGSVPRLRAFTNERNRGIRYTFEFLYAHCTREFVFLNSTDRQWPTACLFDLLPLTGSHDVVIAQRRDKHYGPARALVSWGYNALPRWLFGVETHDAGAVKLVRREIIERFELVSRSPFTEAERLIRAARAGYRIAGVTVETAPRAAGESGGARPGLVADALLDVARVWWDLRRRA